MDRDVLANYVLGANDYSASGIGPTHVLGHSADDGSLANFRARADNRVAFDAHPRRQTTAFRDYYARFNHTKRADLNIGGNFRGSADNS
jgi:hypothetical protein